MTLAISSDRPVCGRSRELLQTSSACDYFAAERQLMQLLETENLDLQVDRDPEIAAVLESAISNALTAAYGHNYQTEDRDAAHLLLQRVLYHINRLNLFWYDDLNSYKNERSLYLHWLRDRIETVWQEWELAQIDVAQLQQLDVKQSLIDRAKIDIEPPLTDNKLYLRSAMTVAGYKQLLAIGSLDGLVEASRNFPRADRSISTQRSLCHSQPMLL